LQPHKGRFFLAANQYVIARLFEAEQAGWQVNDAFVFLRARSGFAAHIHLV
jgi:hypothetical protein